MADRWADLIDDGRLRDRFASSRLCGPPEAHQQRQRDSCDGRMNSATVADYVVAASWRNWLPKPLGLPLKNKLLKDVRACAVNTLADPLVCMALIHMRRCGCSSFYTGSAHFGRIYALANTRKFILATQEPPNVIEPHKGLMTRRRATEGTFEIRCCAGVGNMSIIPKGDVFHPPVPT